MVDGRRERGSSMEAVPWRTARGWLEMGSQQPLEEGGGMGPRSWKAEENGGGPGGRRGGGLLPCPLEGFSPARV